MMRKIQPENDRSEARGEVTYEVPVLINEHRL
jgi:hypothetical protein